MSRHTRVQAALIHDNKILFLKQYNYKRNEEYWMLPGGSMEKGEDPLSAAIRELKEECNLEFDTLSLIDKRSGNGIDVYKEYATFAWVFQKEPTFKLGSESVTYRKIIGYDWVELFNEKEWNDFVKSKQIHPSVMEIRDALIRNKLV